MPPPDPLVLSLPIPPSTNNLFINRKGGIGGRVKGVGYKLWLREAGWTAKQQLGPFVAPLFSGTVAIDILIGINRRSDLDNRLKGLLDLIVTMGIIRDDNLIDDLRIRRRGLSDKVRVEIRAMEGEDGKRGTA